MSFNKDDIYEGVCGAHVDTVKCLSNVFIAQIDAIF